MKITVSAKYVLLVKEIKLAAIWGQKSILFVRQ